MRHVSTLSTRCPAAQSLETAPVLFPSGRATLPFFTKTLRWRPQQVASCKICAIMGQAAEKRVVICGAGIMGAASAYFLAKQGIQATVVERGEVACAASGKAGGFLAAAWQDSSPVGPLGRRSYQLHAQLAEELGAAACGFRNVETLSLSIAEPSGRRAGRSEQLPDWMDGNISQVSTMATENTTAQVHPGKLTHALLDAAARMAGTQVQHGTVEGLETANGSVTGVRVDGRVLPADSVVLAMGPWTGLARKWLPQAPPVLGQIGHSIVIQADGPLSAHCLFVNHRSRAGIPHSPEVFCRPDGTAYIVEGAEIVPMPDDPLSIQADEDRCSDLQEVAAALSTSLANGTVERKQACYRPYAPDGLPVIGPVPGANGVFVASGHGCWGILNGPATGEAVAQLVTGVQPTINLKAFSPARFKSKMYSS